MRFYQQPNIILFIFIGIGTGVICSKLYHNNFSIFFIINTLLFSFTFYKIQFNSKYENMNTNYIVFEYARDVLKFLPDNSIVLLLEIYKQMLLLIFLLVRNSEMIF